MDTLVRDIRKGDVALAALLTALGVWLMVENINAGPQEGVRIDSHSWLMVPVFAVATLPLLWRRRSMTGVLVVTGVALAAHVALFDWVVRCGAGLPLSFALAYSAGRLMRGRAAVLGLLATVGIQVLVQVRDSAAGLGVIPVTALIALAAWGVGAWLQRRAVDSVPVAAPAESYV